MILLVLLLLGMSSVTGENEFVWLILSFFFLKRKRYAVFNDSFNMPGNVSFSFVLKDFDSVEVVHTFYSGFYHCSHATSLTSDLIAFLKMSSV